MGFCEGGDLYHRLKQQKGELLPERQVVEWFVQIAMALEVCGDTNMSNKNHGGYVKSSALGALFYSTCMEGTFFTGTLKHRTSS